MQTGVRQIRLGLNPGRSQHPEPMPAGQLPGLVQQGRLPDSCVTPDDQHTTLLGRAGQQQFDGGDFRRTTDKLGLCSP